MTNIIRNATSMTNHDKMIGYIARSLDSQGYKVQADHISWKDGCPAEMGGFIPDIVGEKDGISLIMEVETCATYSKDHTKDQLSAFTNFGTTYIIVPPSCIRNDQKYDPVPEVKEKLLEWGISQVRVGTCSPFKIEIKYGL
jgi:hypothetical protein